METPGVFENDTQRLMSYPKDFLSDTPEVSEKIPQGYLCKLMLEKRQPRKVAQGWPQIIKTIIVYQT